MSTDAASTPMTIEERARAEAKEVLAYFKNLEALGRFAGEDVTQQKLTFLTMALVNFVRLPPMPNPAMKKTS